MQWRDVQGVIELRGGDLDFEYLHRWAPVLGIPDLLERALAEAPRTRIGRPRERRHGRASRTPFGQPANISSRRRCISSRERDSMSCEMIQTCPNGSSMRPARYP